MDVLKAGIVGPGKVGHLISKALKSVISCEYVTVCGRNLERTKAFAGQYGLNAYVDVSEMVSREKLDLVIVCTPHPSHREPSIAAM